MARLAFGGISVHPMLNDLPAALLPTSALCDVLAAITGRTSWAHCAYHTLQIGTLAGVGAAVAGLVDYQDVPSDPEAQRAGRTHLMLNVGALTMSALNLMLRDARRPRANFLGTMLSLTTLGALAYSALQGSVLAYKHRMALAPAAPARAVGEVRERVGEMAAEARERVGETAERVRRTPRAARGS